MPQYTYALSEKGKTKGVMGFNHAGKSYNVDQKDVNAFRMVTNTEHPAPDFMGLKLIEIKKD